MARVIINADQIEAFAVELKPGVNGVGRHWMNHIQINHATVSDRHCEIIWENYVLRVRDLNSTNRTFINHRPVQEAVWEVGQLLQVGAVNIIIEIPQASAAPRIAIPPLSVPDNFDAHYLEEGVPACANHHQLEAQWQCTRCGRYYCKSCIHEVRRVGGQALQLCPMCSGPCQALEETRRSLAQTKGFFGFLRKLFVPRRT